MPIEIFNSLTRQVEQFNAIDDNAVRIYSCGPTVYSFPSIGNFRTYFLTDIVVRVLKQNGYNIKFIMNLTDVGHLSGDNEGDPDKGEDRLEKAAAKEGKSAKEISQFYTDQFLKDYNKLNLTKPEKFTPATSYIREQIDLIRRLREKGFTYVLEDGVYFDTSKFKNYGQLSGYTEESIREGARVEANPNKKNPADFALWKLSPKDTVRWQEWESPFGLGFPGWHLECSAMIFKELGEQIDIHIGGEDLKMIHHPNEIAQSEAASGRKFVNYWVHGAFVIVDGGRMGKSVGNAYTLSDLEARGFLPLSLRYLYMGTHYRKQLNFSFEALGSAQTALKKLYDIVSGYSLSKNSSGYFNEELVSRFNKALNEDFNLPKALSFVWDAVKDTNMDEDTKVATLLRMDEVLGFNLESYIGFEVPDDINNLAKTRLEYKKTGIWDKADMIRREIEQKGFIIEDTSDGFKIKKRI